jgi:hypothetical protein
MTNRHSVYPAEEVRRRLFEKAPSRLPRSATGQVMLLLSEGNESIRIGVRITERQIHIEDDPTATEEPSRLAVVRGALLDWSSFCRGDEAALSRLRISGDTDVLLTMCALLLAPWSEAARA